MFADVTGLRYWKSERADLSTCEDAQDSNVQQGLFCVADGAGTTLFSNVWAEILVRQFVQAPLMTADPFEMEWWIRQAQKGYRERAPQSDKLNWNARQKALEQGAYSTLATLRFNHLEAFSATAKLLVVGDSCVIVGYSQKQQIVPFPLEHAEEFDRAPYCVPALLKNLNRYTLYPKTKEVTLSPGDIVILATDAVARWIISGGGTSNANNAWKAFLEVAQKTEGDWPEFINDCRTNQSMVDDDSTAIVIRLREDGGEEQRLGLPATFRLEIVETRRAEFERARAINNKELVAVAYGDGRMLNGAGIFLSDMEKAKAREVADALREVLQLVRDTLNLPGFTAKVEPVWWRYADLLIDEPCAENIRKSLAAQGVRLKSPDNVPSHMQIPIPRPVGNEQAAASDNVNQPDHPITAPGDSVHPSGPSRESLEQPGGIEPERARIFTPSLIALDQQQQRASPSLQAFREALVLGEPFAIASSYDPSLDSMLTKEEKRRLQAAQRDVQTLEDVLKEGNASQKVEAYKSLGQPVLNDTGRKQLELAQDFAQALRSRNDERIYLAYSAIEFSPLRKHFIFLKEEQHHIEQARRAFNAVKQFRAILHSNTANITLLMQLYEQIRSQDSSLSPDEQYIIDLSQRFLQAYKTSRQALQSRDSEHLERLVRLYDMLYYSPYGIAFTEDESRQVNAARNYVGSYIPTIMTVNSVSITISHVLALLSVKRHQARSKLVLYRRQLAANPPDPQLVEAYIAHWEQKLAQPNWPATVLNELLERWLLEQKVKEEVGRGNAKRGNVNLEKDLKKEIDQLARELRLEKDPRREIDQMSWQSHAVGDAYQVNMAQISEQDLRDALVPMALKSLVDRYLLAASNGQTISDWLNEQRKAAIISYFERPEKNASITEEQQRCWLFKWWVIQNRKITTI